MLVYLAMSAATSAEVVAIWKSPEDDGVLTVKGVAMMGTAGVVVTKVTDVVGVVWGTSFC